MTRRALATLALVSSLPSSGTSETVDIETRWGWHYLIETDNGVRRRVTYRVSLNGELYEHHPSQFQLSDRPDHVFAPTASELGLIEEGV